MHQIRHEGKSWCEGSFHGSYSSLFITSAIHKAVGLLHSIHRHKPQHANIPIQAHDLLRTIAHPSNSRYLYSGLRHRIQYQQKPKRRELVIKLICTYTQSSTLVAEPYLFNMASRSSTGHIDDTKDDDAWEDISYGRSENIQGKWPLGLCRCFPVVEDIGGRFAPRQPASHLSKT